MNAGMATSRSLLVQASRKYGPLVLLLVLAGFAYRELLGFQGLAPGRGHPEGLEGQLFVPNQKSPLLIYAIAAWMLIARLPLVARQVGRPPRTRVAALSLAAAAGLAIWAHLTVSLPLLIPSLCLLLPGAGALLGGRPAVRLLRLPALFLLLALPIPPVLLNQIAQPMQLFTAALTGHILDALAITNVVLGDMVQTSSHTFQVIESCSGLRSIETLVMSAVLYQEILPHTRLRSWLLVLASPLVGVLINQLRVLSIVLNPFSHFAAVHTLQGVVMIVLGVLLLALLDWLLRRVLPGPAQSLPVERTVRVHDTRWPLWPWPRVAGLAALLLTLGSLRLLTTPFAVERPLHISPYKLPSQLGNWKGETAEIDDQYLGSTHYTQRIQRVYRRDAELVSVFVGVDRRADPNQSGLSPKIALPGAGWQTLESRVVSREHAPPDLRRSIVRDAQGRALLYAWNQGSACFFEELLRNVFGLERSPWQRPYSLTAVRIHTRLSEAPVAEQAAEQRLQEFVGFIQNSFSTSSGEAP